MAQNIYSSDEEGSDFERPKKHPKTKALQDSDEESKSEEDSGSNEENEEADEAAEENGSDDDE